MPNRNAHIGSSLDAFLTEDGILDEVNATAIERVAAWEIAEAMKADRDAE